MSTATLRLITAGVLLFHGVGHAWGILAALGITMGQNHSPDSWALTNLIGNSATRWICAAIWGAALALFVCAGLGLVGWLVPKEWWRPLALIGAVVSGLALVLFWNALPVLFPNKIGAILVNFALIISLVFMTWTSRF